MIRGPVLYRLQMEPVRLGLVLLWSLVCLVAALNAVRGRRGFWKTCVGLGALMVSLSLWRWHVGVLHAGQDVLKELGLYEDRVVVKVAILAVLLLAIGSTLWVWGGRLWHAVHGSRMALLPTIGAVGYLVLLTLSLDNFMPSFLAEQPGRFVTEYAMGALALVGAVRIAFGAGGPQ